jgi:hypothetical protein
VLCRRVVGGLNSKEGEERGGEGRLYLIVSTRFEGNEGGEMRGKRTHIANESAVQSQFAVHS